MSFRWLFLSLVVAALPASVRAAAPAEHVVVLCVDGLPAYLLDDPKAPLTNIRRLAREGAIATAGMRVVNPSVTWPNHTTLITGVRPEKHLVLANGILTRHGTNALVTIVPRHDQADLIHVPTLFEVAHAGGLSTAAIDWPCTRNSSSIDDNFPDVPETLEFTTPRLLEELRSGGWLPEGKLDFIKDFSSPQRDEIWTEATRIVLGKRKPNLLVLHLLNVDGTHHSLGPQTPSGYTAVALADLFVGRVLEAIDAAGIRPTTTVFIVSDHGFTLTPKALLPNAILRREGLLRTGRGGKPEEARVQVVPEGGLGLLYFNDPSLSSAERERVVALFAASEGIAEVLAPEQFAAHGLPHPRTDEHMADLVLVAKDGYGFSASAEGDAFVAPSTAAGVAVGNHGFLADQAKMNATFVVAGAGIQPGVRLGRIDNIAVAPTVAALLGISLPSADGQPLREVLSAP
jgi:predicted AlkP superfamily pyrophosphatase or phosphodiesterase